MLVYSEEIGLHDFSLRTVGPFGYELEAPQVVRRDDPGLHLQAVAAVVVVPADRWHSC